MTPAMETLRAVLLVRSDLTITAADDPSVAALLTAARDVIAEYEAQTPAPRRAS